MRPLLTGGSGRLGTELLKQLEFYAPTHKQFDITLPYTLHGEYSFIVHAAAYTDVAKAEEEQLECYHLNVIGTVNLLKRYPETPFVFISSEYAHNPTTYYSETKLAAEVAVKALAKHYLIIRTIFKSNPWPLEKAFNDQFTQGDYTDVIAPLIIEAIQDWDGKNKTIYVGTGRKTMFELAKRTKPDVKPNSVHDIKGVKIPHDYL